MQQLKLALAASVMVIAAGVAVWGVAEFSSRDSAPVIPQMQRSTPSAPPRTPDAANFKTANDKLVDIASEVPGFGGAYLSEDQNLLNVFLLNPTDKAAVEVELARVYGVDALPPGGIRVVPGQYGGLELVEWYAQMRPPVWSLDGIISTGISHGRNRLSVSVANIETQEAVEAELARLGIPREAVIIEVGVTLRTLPLRYVVFGLTKVELIKWSLAAGFLVTAAAIAVLGYRSFSARRVTPS